MANEICEIDGEAGAKLGNRNNEYKSAFPAWPFPCPACDQDVGGAGIQPDNSMPNRTGQKGRDM